MKFYQETIKLPMNKIERKTIKIWTLLEVNFRKRLQKLKFTWRFDNYLSASCLYKNKNNYILKTTHTCLTNALSIVFLCCSSNPIHLIGVGLSRNLRISSNEHDWKKLEEINSQLLDINIITNFLSSHFSNHFTLYYRKGKDCIYSL